MPAKLLTYLLLPLLLACSQEQAPVNQATTQASSRPAPAIAATVDGKAVYDHYCLACHAAGTGHPGTMRLALRLGEDKAVLTEREDLSVDFVKTIVREGILLMPPFRPSEIDDRELAALAEYLAGKS